MWIANGMLRRMGAARKPEGREGPAGECRPSLVLGRGS